jgi:hypothetical protein
VFAHACRLGAEGIVSKRTRLALSLGDMPRLDQAHAGIRKPARMASIVCCANPNVELAVGPCSRRPLTEVQRPRAMHAGQVRGAAAFDRCSRKSRKLSSSPNLAKDGVCLPPLLQASVGRVRSSVVASCDSTWSLTSARAACTGGAEKFGSPARKTFFDSIDPYATSTVRRSARWAVVVPPVGRLENSMAPEDAPGPLRFKPATFAGLLHRYSQTGHPPPIAGALVYVGTESAPCSKPGEAAATGFLVGAVGPTMSEISAAAGDVRGVLDNAQHPDS